MKKMGFVTCVQLGLSCMEEIYQLGGTLELLITLRDEIEKEKSGRVYLDEFACKHGIPLVKVDHINQEEVMCAVRDRELDWLFIIGWSQIAGPSLLHAPREGCIGIHPTLLPEGRGRASIPWAILKGLEETGVTMFRLDEGVDTGPILGQEHIPLNHEITATEVYRMVNQAHIQLIRGCLGAVVSGTVKPIPQDESKATVWPGRRPEDGRITDDMTVEEALTLVRAVTHPYPGAFFEAEGKILRIWEAEAYTEYIEETAVRQGGVTAILRLKDGVIRLREYEVEDE